MAPFEDALAGAKRLHQKGELRQAEQIYRQVLLEEPDHPEALHLLGLIAHQRGDHAMAIDLIGRAVRLQDNKPIYHCNLAKALAAVGRTDEALDHLQQANQLDPTWAPAHYERALVLRGLGRLEEGAHAYLQAVRLKPDFVQAWHNLGNLRHEQGNLEEAAACFTRAGTLRPDHLLARFGLAKVLHQQGRLEEAAQAYRETLQLRPDHAPAHNNLGSVLQQQGHLAEAEACYREAWRLSPDSAEAVYNLGHVRRLQGDLAQAVACYQRAASLQPENAAILNSLGAALHEGGRLAEAVQVFGQALSLEPRSASTHCNLGMAWLLLGRADQALTALREAVRLDPTLAEAHHLIGQMLVDKPRHEEALVCFREAVRLKPDNPAYVSSLANLLVTMGQDEEGVSVWQQGIRANPDNTLRVELATRLPPIYTSHAELASCRRRLEDGLEQLHAEGVTVDLTDKPSRTLFYAAYHGLNNREVKRRFAALHRAPAPGLHPRSPVAGKIHVGLLSIYFCQHTIGCFTQGMIEHLSRERFFVTVLSMGGRQDAVAQALRACADRYVEVPCDLPTARRLVAEQGLDILYYPDIGMDPFTHALAFSRLAPVQAVGFGHPETTGIETLDYFISSEALDPEDEEPQYTETLVRLSVPPISYYRPWPRDAVGRREGTGFSANEHVYACPQTLFKMHPDFDEVFAGILRGDPRAVIALIDGPNPHWQRLLRQRFAASLGDLQARVRFLRPLPRAAFLNLMAHADVLLDPLHFGSGNTGFEGLSTGTPLVTLPAAYCRGRVTYGMYRWMDMLDCVVHTPQEYIDLALRIGTDRAYRETLRSRILSRSHVLYENLQGVRDLEQFFVEAHEKHS
jgi:predicted O-linked N-acetylglucosamine transferase (SPINDLY family)